MRQRQKRSLFAVLATAFVIILALVCTLGLAACGGSEDCAHENVTWDETKTVEATCGEDGSKTGTCDDCGDTVTEPIPATGAHTGDGGKVTKNASTDGDGEITETCTVCNTVLSTKSFTGEYLAKFVTGAYDSSNTAIPEEAYKYTNPDDSTLTATFTGSVVTSVEFDGEKYIVNGTSDYMDEGQLKAFWGSGSTNHADAAYIAILITADKDDSYTIVSSKSPEGIEMGGASAEESADYNEGYSLFFDVTDAEEGALLFTIVDADENSYEVVLGNVALPGNALIATLYSDGFSMTYNNILVDASDVTLYLYDDGSADLYLTIFMVYYIPLQIPGIEYTIDEATNEFVLIIASLGNAEGTVSYGSDGAIASVTFTEFAGTEQTVVFTATSD